MTTSSLREIHLEPVVPEHYPELYQWATDTRTAFHWRYHGATPSPEQFSEAMWSGVLCQFLATDPTGAHHGIVVCYGADHVNGHAYWAVQGNPNRSTGSGAIVGMVQLVDHVFRHWPFRKLYAELPGYNAAEFGGALRRHATAESALVDHLFYDGRYWDEVTFALYRDAWMVHLRPKFTALLDELAEAA